MTKSNFFSVLLIISAIMFLPVNLSSQVTIGSTDDPQPFSVLELFSNGERGFRLPQLSECQRDAMGVQYLTGNDSIAAMGLQIFNTCNQCVETWNGERWISHCIGETPPAPPIIINCDGRRMVVPRFAHFNLGGREFETARAQMEYAATDINFPSTTTDTSHGSLFGGRFQWGRADMEHAISTDGYFTLWDGATGNAINFADADAAGFYPETGQPRGVAAGRFIMTAPSQSWFNASQPAHADLWGNGVTIETRTDGLPHLIDPGVPGLIAGRYFQSTSWALRDDDDGRGLNDPCRHMPLPGNWRLPTQEEWERLGAYNCNPATVPSVFAFPFPDSILSSVPASSPFTWVRVSCNAGECNPTLAWISAWNSTTRNGFVLYLTDELPYGFSFAKPGLDLLSDSSPEPFLFLPATGRRGSNGNVVNPGMEGIYWSSTFSSLIHARTFAAGSTNVTSSGMQPHSVGVSVRCVRD